LPRWFGCYTDAVVSLADSPRYESGSVPGAGVEGESGIPTGSVHSTSSARTVRELAR
jgi:hypothetical protein